ncbi:MAG: GNAT family N-acetyltransferase [Rhodobacterales bacterium]|nr:GNAT family N-acetyltransferase [Rhodobacterales bacterium]
MSVSLRIATPEDHARALALSTAFHGELGQPTDHLDGALASLLAGVPHAVLYLIGPPKSPVGHAVVSFGYDLGLGGSTATLGELFIRPPVRGRGMGGEAIQALAAALGRHGVVALHIDAAAAPARATVFVRRLRFAARPGQTVLTRLL